MKSPIFRELAAVLLLAATLAGVWRVHGWLEVRREAACPFCGQIFWHSAAPHTQFYIYP